MAVEIKGFASAERHTPVLIIGAGGAGLSMSLLLQQQGISSLLIDRRSDISWVPRARNLNFRSLEVFRGLGLEAEINASGTKPSRMFRKESLVASKQEELLDPSLLVEHIEDITPEAFLWYCPQSKLEPLLLAEGKKRGCDIRYGTELVSFIQNEKGVIATIKDLSTGEIYEQHADYMVAADGAHSRIRKTLNITTKGLGELPEHYIFVYFRADWSEVIRGYESDAVIITNKDARGMFLVTDQDRGMFMIICPPSKDLSPLEYTPELCKSMVLKAMGKPDISVEIISVAPWQAIQRVADEFQDGRVFLVGDSAQTMPPLLGLGVNTAIQSSQNLAWKLAAVLKKKAGSQLLTTYQAERHPMGLLASQQSLTGPAAALIEDMGFDNSYLPKKQLPLLQIIIGYPYISEAILSEASTPSSPEDGRPELIGLPGTRVPHLWVEQQGKRISTLDLFDGSFILLTGIDGTPWCEAALIAGADMGIKLVAYRIGANADLIDIDNGWKIKMGMPTDGAILIRPDDFVAWRSKSMSTNPVEQLVKILTQVLLIRP